MALGNRNFQTRNMGPNDVAVHQQYLKSQGDAAAARHTAAGVSSAAARNAEGDALAAEQAARGSVGAAQAGAVGTAAAGYFGGMGQAEAGRFGALGGLGGAMSQEASNRFGAYSAAEASRQAAMANAAIGRGSSAAMAEVARQTALGNLGSASIGAYGSNANQAMQAFAQNQTAYNQAMAQMQGAGQNAMSSYGQSRNAGLGSLANAYGDAGGRLGAASAVSDMNASFGGDFGGGGGGSSFTGTNPTGTVAAGSYGATPSGGGFFGNVNRSSENSAVPGVADATFAGLGGVGQSLMAQDITGLMDQQYDRSMNDLNAQHYSSRSMPAQMQRQTFGDLLTMNDQFINPVNQGMNQFYGNAEMNTPDFAGGMDQFYENMAGERADYSGILDALRQPASVGRQPTMSGMFGQDAMGAQAMSQLGPLADMMSPAGRARSQREAARINQQARMEGVSRQNDLRERQNSEFARGVAAREAMRRNLDSQGFDGRASMNPFGSSR